MRTVKGIMAVAARCTPQQLIRLDGLVDELRRWKAKRGGRRTRTEANPDNRRSRLQHLDAPIRYGAMEPVRPA